MDIKSLDNLKLKMRFSIIIVIMVTFVMVLVSLLVYFTRKSGTYEFTDTSINAQLSDLKKITSIKFAPNTTSVKEIENTISEQKYFENGFAFLIDDKGNWIAKPPTRFIEYFSQQTIVQVLLKNKNKIIVDGDFGKCWIYRTYDESNNHIIGIAVFEKDFWHPTRNRTFLLIVIGITSGVIMFTILLHFLMQPMTHHLTNLARNINKLSLGVFPERINITRKDEIGKIAESVNQLIDGLRKTADFAEEIGKGNYDFNFTPLSDDDVLGNSLLETRGNLKKAAKDEAERKVEEEERNWATSGLAEFSDILRIDYNSIEDLGFRIIQKLIKYLNINQGGLFILNDEDAKRHYLELVACYAYDRQKFITLKINPGEGLVGSCFLERKTTHIKKVPDSYISITSGLGDANPTSILLVPLVLNDDIYGVLELASFAVLPNYKIAFVEKVAESIASAISNAKTNEKTKKLLQQSQVQANQMILQEKEMKQNLEEMQATQEEMQRLLTLNNLRIEQAKAISGVREICNNTSLNIKEVFEKVTQTMVSGWQYSNYASAKISYQDILVEGIGFVDSEWKLVEETKIKGKEKIVIEVAYSRDFPIEEKGPFLKEEVELLKNITVIIKACIYSKHTL
jgi:HAMP domain-containing protein